MHDGDETLELVYVDAAKSGAPAEEPGPITMRNDLPPGEVRFHCADKEILRFCPDGAVYVRGERVDNNVTVYEAFKTWLSGMTGRKL